MNIQARLRSDVSILSCTRHDTAHPVLTVVDHGEPLWLVWEACGHFGYVAGIVAAANEYDAYEALVDELPTVSAEDVHEAYGFDTDTEFQVALVEGCTGAAGDRQNALELADGYSYQANSSGTGIVWTQDLGRPQPVTREVLDAAEIDLRLGRDE